MTNKKKTKEIAKHILETYPVINKDNLPNALWFAAIEMAEWKEQQMIDKACDFIADWFYDHPHVNMVCSDEFENVDDLLERFKLAMEGGEE